AQEDRTRESQCGERVVRCGLENYHPSIASSSSTSTSSSSSTSSFSLSSPSNAHQHNWSHFSVCVILLLTIASPPFCQGNPDAKRLYDDLLSNYNRLIRPVSNNTDTVLVRLGLRLSQLIDLRPSQFNISSLHTTIILCITEESDNLTPHHRQQKR
ncbi:unnamed protein product, partial [Allacma fusca]